jgi:ribokinase
MAFDIVAIGNINVDFSFYMKRMPARDGEGLSDDFRISHGGSAANFAYTAGRLGLKVAMLGCVGCDPLGIEGVRELEGAGVNCRMVRRVAGKRTGTVCILVDRQGGRRMIAYRGANEELGSAVEGGIPKSRLVHMSNVNGAVLASVSNVGRGGLISLDPGGEAKRLGMGLLRGLDVLLLNEQECKDLTGLPFREGGDLLASEIGIVVIKLGERGAYLVRGTRHLLQPSFEVPVEDTTGAGDAFDAGFLCSLVEGEDMATCLRYGQAVAAIKIGGRGARSNLLSRTTVADFLAKNKEK